MKVTLVCLYEEQLQEIAFVNNLLEELLKGNYDLNVLTVRDYTKKSFFELPVKVLNAASSDIKSIFDEIYAKMDDINSDAYIIPVIDWKSLYNIKKSYLQLSNKHVLFVTDKVDLQETASFVQLVRYLERFRNIHVGINAKCISEEIYNLHCLQTELLPDILKLHLNNRRKYIGWRYHANELRQKIKFHKDLLKHRLMVMFNNPYKETMDSSQSIPKIIHYCWFGGNPLPEKVEKCIASWKLIMPDYELKCWNESNFPFEKYPFAQEALANKKWAFIADVARLHALYYEGGVYLDTDVEVLKSFNDFLEEDAFTSYESLNLIAMAAVGFKKYHIWIAQMLIWYNCIHCDDDYTEIANTKIVSKITKYLYGVHLNGDEQVLSCGLHIYPREYFSPVLEKEGWLVKENTYCIHHFTGMW